MVDKTFSVDAILEGTYAKTCAVDAVLELSGEITLGALTLIVDVDGVRPKYFKRTSKHSILGATNSKRQYTGSDSIQYEVRGIFEGVNRDTDMATLRGYYTDNDEIAFQGYTSTAVQVRIIELKEVEHVVHWEWKIKIEETGNQ